MQLLQSLHAGLRTSLFLGAALCLCAQEPAPPGKAAPAPAVAQGLPPRISAAEYQVQAKAGSVTIAAEFVGHSVPTPQNTYSTEDYVVVELGLFGPPEARLQISPDDFSMRINGKKVPVRGVPAGVVVGALKDPEWVPPEGTAKGSKSKVNTGGEQGEPSTPAVEPKMPFELQRAMSQKVQKSALMLGDRALPQAGLIFFPYRGKLKGITSLDLIYSGPAGEATLKLQR